jgi:hypothetical protein
MATTDVVPKRTDSVVETVTVVDNKCPACAHPWDEHDVISARYCTATSAGALTRGCICTS